MMVVAPEDAGWQKASPATRQPTPGRPVTGGLITQAALPLVFVTLQVGALPPVPSVN